MLALRRCTFQEMGTVGLIKLTDQGLPKKMLTLRIVESLLVPPALLAVFVQVVASELLLGTVDLMAASSHVIRILRRPKA